jgi:hypothetical protein
MPLVQLVLLLGFLEAVVFRVQNIALGLQITREELNGRAQSGSYLCRYYAGSATFEIRGVQK